jgi:hypothetical protein
MTDPPTEMGGDCRLERELDPDQLQRLRLALVNLARAWWQVHVRRQPAETPEDVDLTS